jgi:SAM-dependent MidA family methyltransferase
MSEPERLDHFMARANAAYYASRDPFADFTTSPEISQVFGELLGVWAVSAWAQMGAPDPVLLVEAGPGRGTLMADALRTVARVAPDFAAALRVHLIETSPRLRAEQAARVGSAAWHDSLGDIPAGPAIVLANEFLDALPIRQFTRVAGAWAERHVVGGHFVALPCAHADDDAADGAVLEIGEAARDWVAGLAARLVREGGAALIVDYGFAEPQHKDTLQALRHGRPVSPLVKAGTADLTAHVDFGALSSAARAQGAWVRGPVTQGDFLRALGLQARVDRLAALHPARAAELVAGAHRLAAPDQMGSLFKVLAVTGEKDHRPLIAAQPKFARHLLLPSGQMT